MTKNRKFVQYHNNKAIDLCKMTAYNKNVPRERGHGSRPIEGREILEIPLKEGTVMKKNFLNYLVKACAAYEYSMGWMSHTCVTRKAAESSAGNTMKKQGRALGGLS